MEKIYSLRLDYESGQRLQQLADESFRTRAGVIRYLLNLAIQNPNLIIPFIGNEVCDSSNKVIKLTGHRGEEVQP